MGRKPLGIDLVDRMMGPPQAKERLMAVLESLEGEETVGELAHIIGVKRSRFYELRERALCGALDALVERPAGRRARERDARDEQIASLEAELGSLREQLVAAQVRTEMALVMPHLLKGGAGRGPKLKPGRGARRNGGSRATSGA